jgi:hypothetical protein
MPSRSGAFKHVQRPSRNAPRSEGALPPRRRRETPTATHTRPTARSALTAEQPKREASNETPVFLLKARPDALHNGSRKGAAPFLGQGVRGLRERPGLLLAPCLRGRNLGQRAGTVRARLSVGNTISQPPTQLRPAPHRRHPRPRAPARPRLPRAQAERGQEPPRSTPLPQTTTRTHGLHHPQKRTPIDIGATLAQAGALSLARLGAGAALCPAGGSRWLSCRKRATFAGS